MTCIGRSNQYFVNNKGVRFDAGLCVITTSNEPYEDDGDYDWGD